METVQSLFNIKNTDNAMFIRSERQSTEQTEDYAIKKVVATQELIVNKLFLDKDSDTYFQYNSATSELELYVNGVLTMGW